MNTPKSPHAKGISQGVLIGTLIAVIATIVAIVFWWDSIVQITVNQDRLREFVQSAGVWAPLAFIGIQFLQVLFAPIPGQAAGLIAGALFGPWLGALYSIVGAFLGFTFIFILAKKLGRPFVERFIDEAYLKKFDYLTKKAGPMVFFLIFLLPGFPDDAICYIAGLSSIPLRTLIIISLAGRIPGYLLTSFIGAGIGEANRNMVLAIVIPTIIVLLIAFWKRQEIERWVRSLARDKKST